MFFSGRKDKKGGSKKKTKLTKQRKDPVAENGRTDKQTNATDRRGGMIQIPPPVAVKKRPKTGDNIKTSDVEKIWNKKKEK
ncbi:MAG: hypothetical protein LBE48_02120 [Methanomassiliicoccaceae archaeon]|nr:hypothetical protein [Methanomassiliicoccaceae archaeon]